MSFSIITGLPGGGKSYLGVETAKKAALEGAVVHTNLPLVQEEWEKLGLWEKIVILPRDPSKWIWFEKKIVDGSEVEVPCSDCIIGGQEGRENVVIFDEASIVFRTKDQAKNKDKHQAVFDLIALSRHVGLEILFLAQHHDNVSADLRRMCQLRTRCIAAKDIPVIGFVAVRFFGDFARAVYRGGESREPFMRSWHRFRPEIGALYKTHGMAESVSMRVDATRVSKGMDQGKKKGLLLFIGAPLLCLIVIFFAGWKIKRDFYDGPKQAAAPAASDALAKVSPAPSGHTASAPATVVKPKGGWRVMEWDPADEFVFAGRVVSDSGVTVFTRDRHRLRVGGDYMGEQLIEYAQYAGWHYFKTAFGRLVVVRPIYATERAALPPVSGSGSEHRGQQESVVSPLTDAISGGIQQLKGI